MPVVSGQGPISQETPKLLELDQNSSLLTWHGHGGRSYFVQVSDPSDHLSKWFWAPLIEAGADAPISYEVGSTADKGFFRIHYTDQLPAAGETLDTADYDGDGLSNLDEVNPVAGEATNPLNTDTDGDGLPDGWERAHGLDPNDDGSLNVANGPSGFFQGSDQTNLEAFQQGVGSDPGSTLADHDGDGLENENDADPQEKLIDWEPVPEGSYAVVDLNMEPLPTSWLPHARSPVPAVLNDHGAVCREPHLPNEDLPGGGGDELTPAVWDGTSIPVQWNVLPDYINAVGSPEAFNDFHTSFNNAGNVFHGLNLDDGSDNSPGVRAITIRWNDSASAPSKYGSYDRNTHRSVEARFDNLASSERTYQESTGGNPGFHTTTITAGSFTATGTDEGTEDNRPYLLRFNYYSLAPAISRTGKVVVWQDDQFHVNDTPVPSGYPFGLTADPHDHDLVVSQASDTPEGIAMHRHRNGSWERMPMPGIMDMNAAGTGITFPNHQIWRNGSTVELDDLLAGSGWSEFKAEQINERGMILGSAKPDGGTDYKAVLLVPLEFSVFPPEPTEEEIADAEGDTWEIETFQIPADDPEFWVQANVFVEGRDEDGEQMMLPVADGSVITWEIVDEESDDGAVLSSTTSETEGGHAAVKLTTSTVPGERFKVRGKLTTLKIPTGEESPRTVTSTNGLAEIRTQLFEVVPGNTHLVSVTSDKGSVPADEASEIVVEAVLTDAEGNPVARGTDVNWRVSGGGHIKERDHLVVGEDGKAMATIVSGSVVGNQTVTVEADGVLGNIQLGNSAVNIVSLAPATASLDLATTKSSTVTVQTDGVADGAPVSWEVSKGRLVQQGESIQGDQAEAVFVADSATIGIATIIVTIGNAVSTCEIDVTSSEPSSIEIGQPLLVHDSTADGSENVEELGGGNTAVPYFAFSPLTIRSPGNAGEWATLGFSGSYAVKGHSFHFDTEESGSSPSVPAGFPAMLAGGAEIEYGWNIVRTGAGSLSLPEPTATCTVAHGPGLSLDDGSTIRFSVRAEEGAGTVFSKTGEYTARFLADGRLEFEFGSGQQAVAVASAASLDDGLWHDVSVTAGSGKLLLETDGVATSAPLAATPAGGSASLVIGGFTGYFDDLRFTHRQQGLQGIVLSSTGLDAQGRVQLDANGEATIQVSAQTAGEGPPDGVVGQTVDIEVEVAGESVSAEEAITVTDKGTAVLIRAIAGQTAIIGTATQNLNKAELAEQFLKRGVKAADKAGALPQDMGATAAARGDCGYLIAVWMEETVDEAGIVRPLMNVSAQNLPGEVAEVLNWMLAEMMVDAGQRGESEEFADYILRNHKELLLALEALSAGDVPEFLALAGVLDGEEGFAKGSAVTDQVGRGTIQAVARDGVDATLNGYDILSTWYNNQNWDWTGGVTMRTRADGVATLRRLQKSMIEGVVGNADGTQEAIRLCSEALVAQGIIVPEGAAALGFAFGIVEAGEQLGQDVAQPDLLAQTAMQLLDLTVSAIGGDTQAVEALKEIGSMAVIAPISTLPECKDEWDQGKYFEAGSKAVAAVEVALVAKYVKDLAVKSTRKALLWGRHRTTDWQATYAHIGKTAEVLAFKRLNRKGFRDIVPIRNESNHGIDWVCRDRNEGIVFIEVKGHRLDAAPRLSRSQEDMKAFTASRLQQAVDGNGHWNNVSPEVRSNAETLLDLLNSPDSTIRGYVVNVDYAVSKLPRVRYFEWLNGVGELANPKP